MVSNLLSWNDGDTGKVEFVDTSAINANVRQGTPDLLPMTILKKKVKFIQVENEKSMGDYLLQHLCCRNI